MLLLTISRDYWGICVMGDCPWRLVHLYRIQGNCMLHQVLGRGGGRYPRNNIYEMHLVTKLKMARDYTKWGDLSRAS